MKEIRNGETEVIRRKIREAKESGNPERIEADVDDYRKLLAEVITLDTASKSKGADSPINWKSVDKAVVKRNDNPTFVRMTQNLNADSVLGELDALKEQPLNQFLTRQAERLNANQAAQPQAQQNIQPNVQQRQNVNERPEEREVVLN